MQKSHEEVGKGGIKKKLEVPSTLRSSSSHSGDTTSAEMCVDRGWPVVRKARRQVGTRRGRPSINVARPTVKQYDVAPIIDGNSSFALLLARSYPDPEPRPDTFGEKETLSRREPLISGGNKTMLIEFCLCAAQNFNVHFLALNLMQLGIMKNDAVRIN